METHPGKTTKVLNWNTNDYGIFVSMKLTNLLLIGILIAIAAPGGYFVYKDMQLQECLEDLSYGYGHKLKEMANCLSLGASAEEVTLAAKLYESAR